MQKFYAILLICLIFFVAPGCTPAKQAVPTALPTIIPPPGWHLLENNGFQIWLPESFIGGTNADMDAIIQRLTQMAPQFGTTAQSIKQQASSFIIFAIDTDKNYAGYNTDMVVGKEPISSPFVMDNFIDTTAKDMLNGNSHYQIQSKEFVTSSRYPTGKLVMELNSPATGDVIQIMYAIKNGGAVWQIVFTTPAVEFQQRLQAFEQIAATASVPYSAESSNPEGQNSQEIIFLFGAGLLIIGLTARAFIKPRKKIEPVQAKIEPVQAKKASRKKKVKK